MTKLSRRQFLKAACLAGGSAIVGGCTDPVRKLIPYVIPPEDIVPGEATWYATTCRECPAGCGILAKNRDGRVIKAEGNPLHPVNAGKLCARGQASVQGVYNPDRFQGPMVRDGKGRLNPVSWAEAERVLVGALRPAAAGGRKDPRIAFISDLVTGSEQRVVRRWLESVGKGQHLMFEPFAYEALRNANELVFGSGIIPSFRLDRADFIISFGADFLETWLSNVEFSRQFASFHEPGKERKGFFVYVGPRLSLTGANADLWMAVPPGGESVIAIGLLRLLLGMGLPTAMSPEGKARLEAAASAFTPEMVTRATGVDEATLRFVATAWSGAQRPLALAQGMSFGDPRALETAVAVNLLNSLSAGTAQVVNFSDPLSLSQAAPAEEVRRLGEVMAAGEFDVAIVCRANPVFHLPRAWRFGEALAKVPLVVSLSSYPDETAEYAHLVMPTHTFMESWGDYKPRHSVRSLMQPVMGPFFNTRHLADILLSSGKAVQPAAFPERDAYEVTRTGEPDAHWVRDLERGGSWEETTPGKYPAATLPSSFGFRMARDGTRATDKRFAFVSYPTVQFFDGRMVNRPLLQEMPDPMSMITWSGWVELNSGDASRMGVETGDVLALRSDGGIVKASAYVSSTIVPGVVAMPMGRGHTAFGRYDGLAEQNPLLLSPGDLNEAGGVVWCLSSVSVKREGSRNPVANTDGSGYQHGRNLARSISLATFTATAGQAPEVVMPLPQGFSRERDFYPPHEHDAYRWAMAVDLDRCIGCGACVIACYAENNVPVVGRTQVLKGREMSWLHIERYFEPEQPFVRFLPMLCQHCDEAPCEAVCPVFAPNHSKEGVNNQVYNRCIGTRFCSQNCPYKVRRFNWHTWKHVPPLEWQLNPDVTVRTKGVMEKCSFCIQRIVQAKMKAKTEGRLVRDGEFTTACAQTCPAEALVFGNLKDPASRVSRLVGEARAYQVLGDLNTKPAVIYLKKITQPVKLRA